MYLLLIEVADHFQLLYKNVVHFVGGWGHDLFFITYLHGV
jgi:hypothetical protein